MVAFVKRKFMHVVGSCRQQRETPNNIKFIIIAVVKTTLFVQFVSRRNTIKPFRETKTQQTKNITRMMKIVKGTMLLDKRKR